MELLCKTKNVDIQKDTLGGNMKKWIENIYAGAIGRFLRVALATAIGTGATKLGSNEWYISLAPFLALLGKKLRDNNPGKFLWLPF